MMTPEQLNAWLVEIEKTPDQIQRVLLRIHALAAAKSMESNGQKFHCHPFNTFAELSQPREKEEE